MRESHGQQESVLSHLMLIETKRCCGDIEEEICYLFNKEKLSPKDAENHMRNGIYTPYGVELSKSQWLGLFKNQKIKEESEK